MNIDIKDVITLSDNNKYIVVSKTSFQDKTYYYIVDINNAESLKFLIEDGNELVEIEDKELIQTLLPLLANEIKDDLDNIIEQLFQEN